MAIHYGFQDKFMLSLNLTKHRNKHFPNAPYLLGGGAGQMASSHLSTGTAPTGSFHRYTSWERFFSQTTAHLLPWAPTGGGRKKKGISFVLFVTAFKTQTSPRPRTHTRRSRAARLSTPRLRARALTLQAGLTSYLKRFLTQRKKIQQVKSFYMFVRLETSV